ncbi:MAG TPA: hypothetical protein VK528_00955, partial [Flavobacterium sp.]|nr:hypothetical protein [Flavobacterium sp.]
MRIITLSEKKIYYLFLCLTFFAGLTISSAQCPTVADPTQSFCDVQSPTIGSLIATNNGGGIVWYANATGGSPLSNAVGLVDGQDYFADSTAGGCVRQAVVVTVYGAPDAQSFQGPCVDNPSDATISDLTSP